MFKRLKNKVSNLLDVLSWKFVGWRLTRMYENHFAGLTPFENNIRWNINVGGVKIGFSAPQPKDDKEMGKVLCEIGSMMQAKRTEYKL